MNRMEQMCLKPKRISDRIGTDKLRHRRGAGAREMETQWNCKGLVVENSHRFGNVLTKSVNC